MSSNMKPPEGGGRRADERRWARIVPGTPVLLSQVEGVSYAAEQYRNLAFQVVQRRQQLGADSLVVATSSPDSGTGKTLTALNLALTLAREGDERVLLVEGDLWKPTMREYLELDPKTPGLAQLLGGAATLEDSVATVWGTELDVLLSGEMGRTTGLMAQSRLGRALEEMRSTYAVVVIDSPPIVLASGRALSSSADAVLAIVRSGQTKRRGIEEALSILGPDKVLGFVLNAARPTSETGYAYYSGYARSLEETRKAAPGARRARRRRIGAVLATALASVAIGFWLLRPQPEGPAAPETPAAVPVAPEPESLETAAEAPAGVSGHSTVLADLLDGARTAARAVGRYDISYVQLGYPGGDPGLDRGTAADLVVRAFRQAGLDLQQEIHQDLLQSPQSYGASQPDTNIDHRRVRNLMTWFARHGLELGTAADGGDWQPGDVVFWSTDKPGWPNHVGIVSDRRAESGNWKVLHHFKASATGSGAEEDALTRWPIEGRYRWTAAGGE